MWEKMRQAHLEREAQRKHRLEVKMTSDPNEMQALLEQRLQSIQWPRETTVAVEIASDCRAVSIDVDLPEVEDIPRKTASYSGRGWKLSFKTLSDTKHAQLYMRHIHGIGFRVIGETFAALAAIVSVTLSGYSQRPNSATGQVADEYLYSVRISRQQWETLNFNNLSVIDVIEAFNLFDLRRQLLPGGRLKAIQPFEAVPRG
jgi:hypothetical protein